MSVGALTLLVKVKVTALPSPLKRSASSFGLDLNGSNGRELLPMYGILVHLN